jgi:hypothetical protein
MCSTELNLPIGKIFFINEKKFMILVDNNNFIIYKINEKNKKIYYLEDNKKIDSSIKRFKKIEDIKDLINSNDIFFKTTEKEININEKLTENEIIFIKDFSIKNITENLYKKIIPNFNDLIVSNNSLFFLNKNKKIYFSQNIRNDYIIINFFNHKIQIKKNSKLRLNYYKEKIENMISYYNYFDHSIIQMFIINNEIKTLNKRNYQISNVNYQISNLKYLIKQNGVEIIRLDINRKNENVFKFDLILKDFSIKIKFKNLFLIENIGEITEDIEGNFEKN